MGQIHFRHCCMQVNTRQIFAYYGKRSNFGTLSRINRKTHVIYLEIVQSNLDKQLTKFPDRRYLRNSSKEEIIMKPILRETCNKQKSKYLFKRKLASQITAKI